MSSLKVDDALRLEAQLFIKQICWVTLIRRCRAPCSYLCNSLTTRRPKGVSLLNERRRRRCWHNFKGYQRVRIDLLDERLEGRCFLVIFFRLLYSSLEEAFEKQNRKCLIRNPCPCSSIYVSQSRNGWCCWWWCLPYLRSDLFKNSPRNRFMAE